MGNITTNPKPITKGLCAKAMSFSPVESPCTDTPDKKQLEPYGTMKTVEHIFATFNFFYGRRWASDQCGTETTAGLKRAWLRIVSAMKVKHIEQAIDYLLSLENDCYVGYAPNPLEFGQLPKKIKAKSIPPVDECYNAALRRDWQLHPIVYPAAMACDLYWLKTQASFYEGRKRFTGHYIHQKEKYLRGELLLQPERNQKQLAKLENELKQVKGEPQLELSKKMARFKNLSVYPNFMASKSLWSKLSIYCGAISDKGVPSWVQKKKASCQVEVVSS